MIIAKFLPAGGKGSGRLEHMGHALDLASSSSDHTCAAIEAGSQLTSMKNAAQRLAIACFVLTVVGGMAVAGVVDECSDQKLRPPEVRLRACTEIISSPSFGPNEKALAYRIRGEGHTDAGAAQLAIADFTESIRLNKDNMLAFAGRGRAKFTAGNYHGSIVDYTEAIRLSPTTSDLYVARGHAYIVSGKVDAAILDLTEAIRLNPTNANAFNTRGVAYVKKGDLVRALEDYTAAIAIFPFPEIYANRGYVYAAQGKKIDAINDLRHALLHDPSLVEAEDALKRLGADGTIAIETDRRVREGKALAENQCSSCHAVGATGVSPDEKATEFRNVYRRHPLFAMRAPLTKGIRATHDQMPQFSSSDEELDTIIAYINSLSTQDRLVQ